MVLFTNEEHKLICKLKIIHKSNVTESEMSNYIEKYYIYHLSLSNCIIQLYSECIHFQGPL